MTKYKFWSDYKHNISDVKSINYLLSLLTSTPKKVTIPKLDKISKNSRFLLALGPKNKIIGMATLAISTIPTGVCGHIEDVVVDDNFRGQGIGKTLIKKLIIEAKKNKLQKISLTSKPARVEANKLYQSLNFVKVETNVYKLILI
ncbi:MAG: GNAT family N-acetyltransferase [Candidatus Shapirobacteria bacterium]